jgi:hypothetical protein
VAWLRLLIKRSFSRAKDKPAAAYTGRLVRQMWIRRNPWWLIGLGFAGVTASLVASASGWLGPLVQCGADGAAVCVSWPPLVEFGVWLLFVACLVCLLAWQVTTWRKDRTSVVDQSS